MYDYELETEDKDLKKVGLELMFMTPEKCSNDKGVTAVELAKLVALPLEIVKKKLNILKEEGIVRIIGINPKYWKFDNYTPPEGQKIDYNAQALDRVRNNLTNEQVMHNTVNGKYNVKR